MKLEKSQAVYVIYNPELHITKVGISDNPAVRMYALECASGCVLELRYVTNHIRNAMEIEQKAHALLAKHRRKGEWFNITPEEAEATIKPLLESAILDTVSSMYQRGETISAIAEATGVTRQAILYKLQAYGFHNNKGAIVAIPPKTKTVMSAAVVIPVKKENEARNSSIVYLDDDQPPKSHNFSYGERVDRNIKKSNEWFQASVYKDGAFIMAYTKDLDKAKQFRDQIR